MAEPEAGCVAKTVAKERFALSDKDIQAVPFTRSGSSKLYSTLNVQAAAVQKYGSVQAAYDEAAHRASTKVSRKRKRDADEVRTAARLSRQTELKQALGELGLVRRADSHLCDAYEAGEGGTSKSAAEVAVVMARMKYLHEYCHEFDDELQQVEDDIDSQVEELAEEEYWESGKGFKCIPGESKVYFSGIRSMARSEVCGGRSMLEMKEGMVDRDNAWPEKWPWLE